MHYWHTLLVKAPTPDDAELEVGRFLDKHKHEVWEYYNVGGKWTGIHADDILPVKGNEEKVRAAIDTQLAAQKMSLQDCKAKLQDKGIEIAGLVTPQESYEMSGDPSILIWAGQLLQLAGQLIGNTYCLQSWFWDIEEDTSYLTESRWAAVVGQADSYWLVSVDLHK